MPAPTLTVELYYAVQYPRHWIVRDTAGWRWLVPAQRGGWQKRTILHANLTLHRYPGSREGEENTLRRIGYEREGVTA